MNDKAHNRVGFNGFAEINNRNENEKRRYNKNSRTFNK